MERTVVMARILGANGDFSLRNQIGFAGLDETCGSRLEKGCFNGELFEFG